MYFFHGIAVYVYMDQQKFKSSPHGIMLAYIDHQIEKKKKISLTSFSLPFTSPHTGTPLATLSGRGSSTRSDGWTTSPTPRTSTITATVRAGRR